MYNINPGVEAYPTYNTTNKDWLVAMFRLVEKINRVYYPGSPSGKTVANDEEFGICLSFPGWRFNKYCYNTLEVEIFPRSIAFTESDENEEIDTYIVRNSNLYPSMLDVYNKVTTLVVNNISNYDQSKEPPF